jgi:glyoxylase-like metal-dependent hydrolase (beta-lactamase superfamily II)
VALKFDELMKTWETKSGYKIIRILAGRSNVFLLTNGIKNILIDTSVKSNWEKLEKRLNTLNITQLDYLILTHAHFDHAGNSFKLREKYKAQVIVHESETSYLTSGDNIIPNGTNPLTRALIYLFAKKVFPRLKFEPCKYNLAVGSNLDLKDLGFNAYIIHTPGHTKGSMSIVVDNEIALAGDAMFGIFKWSIFPPYASDACQMIKSWGVLLDTNCSLFIPGHGSANNRKLVLENFEKRKTDIESRS